MVHRYSLESYEDGCGAPHLRSTALIVVAAVCGIFVLMLASQQGQVRLFCALAFAATVAYGLRRFLKERTIVLHRAVSLGRVIESRKLRTSDGGYNYEAKYEFTVLDGTAYLGNSGLTIRELPTEGSEIMVLYNPENPAQNLPQDLFWFYKFNHKFDFRGNA